MFFCIQIFYGSDEKDVYTVGYVALTNEELVDRKGEKYYDGF